MKTKELGGDRAIVGYSNGQIVAAARNGKVTIMNKNLGIMREFDGPSSGIQSICANETYLALCDFIGSVRYYNRNGDVEPKVRFSNFLLF